MMDAVSPAMPVHDPVRATRDGSLPASPAARRPPRRSWKDPRLLVGLSIVAVCVLLGARILGTADDTVAVYAVRADLGAGAEVGSEDVERQEVRFGSAALADRYVDADAPLPEDAVALRALGAGELLPRAALADAAGEALVEVPLAASADAVPATLRPGATVDVWVTPAAGSGGPATSRRVFEGVTVLALPSAGSALGPASTRQVVIGVPEAEDDALAEALGLVTSGTVVIVRRS